MSPLEAAVDRIAEAGTRITLAELAWIDRLLVKLGTRIDAAVAAAERLLGADQELSQTDRTRR